MRVENIKKRYGKKMVLKNITFDAQKGECIGILGCNGSGKSTLFGILAGVFKSDNGAFIYNGTDLLQSEKERNRILGYVPQNTPLFEELSAKDNLRLWYDKKSMEYELSEGVLAMLGINEFINIPVRKMSGGMKKRLAIGCCVANNPEILILDEPSAALDIVCKENILNYLLNFKNNGGIVLLATHDTNEIPFCDKLFILKDGELIPYEYDGDLHRLAGCL